MDASVEAPVLVNSNEQYFIFSSLEVLPFGDFFSGTLEELFEISPVDGKVIFEVLSNNNLPIVRVTNSFKFRGKVNHWSGELSAEAGTFGMTYFLQKHLVFLFENSEDFRNTDLLDGLKTSSSNIKDVIETKLKSSDIQTLYRLWD